MKNSLKLPPQDYLRKIFDYDPDTGILTWKITMGRRAVAGNRAGTQNPSGYRNIKIHGVVYKEHRIIWKLVHGTEPDEVDHENHIKNGNKLSNLRQGTHSDNGGNRTVQKNNKLGIKGVSKHTQCDSYVAQIKVNGKKINLGSFRTPEKAAEAYKKAAIKYFGRFARLE